jgi:ABC-type multidrug transport system ATPase subunit
VTPAPDLAIATHGLVKAYRRQVAVDQIDLAVPRGSVYGFLGPNGSGKTTTIRVLLGLAGATAGEISVLGHPVPRDLRQVLPRVGALVEGPAFYPFLSGADNLRRLDAADRDAPARSREARVRSALERVGLTAAARKRVRAYSLGMKQRLGIAAALLGPRDLLVLDEPTNGLDPQGTREVRHLVSSLAADGTTVFVSSHLLAEIEQICTHAGVMSAGRLVAQGPLATLAAAGTSRLRLTAGRRHRERRPGPPRHRGRDGHRRRRHRGAGRRSRAGTGEDRGRTRPGRRPGPGVQRGPRKPRGTVRGPHRRGVRRCPLTAHPPPTRQPRRPQRRPSRATGRRDCAARSSPPRW